MTHLREDELVEAARRVMERAYAPYSQFRVGAAVLGATGQIYAGANVENASYPVGLCAERSAIATAVSAGERTLLAVAIATDTDEPVCPCGMCRQMIREFAEDLPIVLSTRADERHRHTLSGLLPHSFSPRDLNRDS
jgi:cytidine deaminase